MECPKCECTESHKSEYVEEGYIVETSYTCSECGFYIGTMSYGVWFDGDDDLLIDSVQ